ncbi:MAG: hypothetical protein ACR2NZ_01945 [Rubripirellula sp.]
MLRLPFVLLAFTIASLTSQSVRGHEAETLPSTSTLRLYFMPEEANRQLGTMPFKPDVAKLYVDGSYVGDAVINLLGHMPVLNFEAGQHTVTVRMMDGRKFESKITFLGHGSTQILVVDLPKLSSQKQK